MKVSTILEGYQNAVGFSPEAQAKKEKYKAAVWDMLQQSYAAIGGIKGNGFGSPDEMVQKIPFWKVITKEGTPIAVVMYKDKGGRKVVASGTDGSRAGKLAYMNLRGDELNRSYGEQSKAALVSTMKSIPWDILKDFIATPDEASKTTGEEVEAISHIDKNEWPEDAVKIIDRFPMLKDFGYITEIGNGIKVFKVMIGTPGKKIS